MTIPQELLSLWMNSDGKFNVDLMLMDFASLTLAILAIIVFFARAVRNLKASRVRKAVCYFGAATILLASPIYIKPITWELQFAKLRVFRDRYDACKERADKYSDINSFGLCSVRIHGNAYQMILYDSGGEITTPRDQQSESFKKFLMSRASPVFSSCGVVSAPIVDHFYFVQADCG
jgi:hypothetical protein